VLRSQFTSPANRSVNILDLQMTQGAKASGFAMSSLIDGNDSKMLLKPAQESGVRAMAMTSRKAMNNDNGHLTSTTFCGINLGAIVRRKQAL
jgi:hypothetical protein